MTTRPELNIPPETTLSHYGDLAVEARCYRPLETVTVRVSARRCDDTRCRIRVCDPLQRPYVEQDVKLVDRVAEFEFEAAGVLGCHYVYLVWPDRSPADFKTPYSRYTTIWVDAETGVQSGEPDFDALYAYTRDHLRLSRREYEWSQGRMVGYVSADSGHFDGIWLRDFIYGLPAYRHWERDMTCGLDRFFECQSSDGMLPDGIERDGRSWRVGLESDVEYIAVLGVWQTWQATGDDAWMQAKLPALEKALAYIQHDSKHWDASRQLIRRQHSCDTWDFDIDGATDKGIHRHVIATCDQTGYYLAFTAMSVMYRHLGDVVPADRWDALARAYRKRAVKLLWDGGKFLHHVHVDDINHGGFDEHAQLAMSNTWAVTRGLASQEQARQIIDLYRRRHEETGDAYPWWSLLPGYPDQLKYFSQPHLKQGGYANGGLFPWVGGELCRGAFLSGREAYGVKLLRQYARHLREGKGGYVWYWPNGEPGLRTTNEVPYSGWGMAEWLSALLEGLAGIRDRGALLRQVHVSPRWAAAGIRRVLVTFRYAASQGYFCYRYEMDPCTRRLTITCCGSGDEASFHLLLPEHWLPDRVAANGISVPYRMELSGGSRYVAFSVPIVGRSFVYVDCRETE